MDKVAKVLQEIHDYNKKIEINEIEIDSLIYKIYGLTDEEIRIIEYVCNVWKANL